MSTPATAHSDRVDACHPEGITKVLAIVDALDGRLRGDHLDPRTDQAWWATLHAEARREDFADPLKLCSLQALRQLVASNEQPPDAHKILLLFYLSSAYFRHVQRPKELEELIRVARATGTTTPIDEYGGNDLLAGFDALLIQHRSRFAQPGLMAAYDLADRAAKRLTRVLAFRRTRRAIGLELLELTAFRTHPRFAEVSAAVASDFEAEHVSITTDSPELRAEALIFEARYEALPRPPSWDANYRRAIELVSQAMAIDEPRHGNEAAYRLRMTSYEQRLNVLSALDALSGSAKDLEGRLTARQDEMLQAVRRESIQLLGLLAGVVGLVTSLFAATKGGPQELIVAALASSSAIAGFLLVFTVLQGGGPAFVRRVVLTALLLVLMLAAAIGVWKLL